MSTVKTLSLGDRMKLYERALDTKLNPCMNYMIRLDGKNFSKLTKCWPLKKPFDKNFNEAMNAAAQSLFQLIPNIKLAWHGSDEISVWFIFPDAGNPFFDGRIQKIVSLAASKASVAFNMKFQQLIGKDIEFGIFDARIMQFPTEIEAMNCFIFRQRDCIRNSISGFAEAYFSSKTLLNKNSDEKIQILNTINGFNFDKVECWTKFGTFIHKKMFEIKQESGESYIRTGYIDTSFKINNITDFENFLNTTKEIEHITEEQWISIKNKHKEI